MVPLDGMARSLTQPDGVIDDPLIAVICTAVGQTASAFLSPTPVVVLSRNENVPSALRVMLLALRAVMSTVPVRPVIWKVYVCWPLPGIAVLTSLSSFTE